MKLLIMQFIFHIQMFRGSLRTCLHHRTVWARIRNHCYSCTSHYSI